MKLFSLIIFSFYLILPDQAIGQMPDYHVQVLNENVGIRNYLILAIVKDKKDFLWILYHDGIQRFDGKRIKDFIIDGQTQSILCDHQNGIWVTTRKQVFKFANDYRGFQPVKFIDTASNLIGSVFQYPGNKIYLQTQNGFYKYDSVKNIFLPADLGVFPFKKISSRPFSYYKETIFFQAADSLYSLNLVNKKLKSLPLFNIFSMQAINENKVLLSDWNYVTSWYDFNNNKISRINSSQIFPSKKDSFFTIGRVAQIDANRYLVSSQKGLLEYNIEKDSFKLLHLFYQGHPLQLMQSSSVIYKDDQENVWMSYEGGIAYFSLKQQIGLVRNATSESAQVTWNNDVRNFAEDEKRNLWFVTVNGFNYWNTTTGEIKIFPSRKNNTTPIIYPSIRGLAYDGKYVILGPTNFGLWLYDPVTETYKRPVYTQDSAGIKIKSKLEGDFINHILTLKNGDHIIAARDAVYTLAKSTYLINEIYSGGTHFCYQDSRQRIWIGTGNSLHCFDSSYHYLFKVPVPIGNNYMRSMYENGTDEFFIGCDGLYTLSLDQNAFSVKKLNPFFDHLNINFLFKDKLNRLWIGSDFGLFLYWPEQNKIQSFDYADNIQGVGFYGQGVFKSSSGIVYIGGTNGINYLRPEDIGERNDVLHVSVVNMIVNADDSSFLNNSLPPQFKYFQNSLKMEFVAPYYNNPNRIRYRYKLAGLDDSWKENGTNTTVFFTSLPSGKYEFKAAASLNGSDWFVSDAINFVITPPFWKTWWFYILCALLIVTLFYLFYRYRIKQIMKIQAVRNRISSELHDDIGTKLTNINILSTLTTQAMDDPEKAKELLGRISSEVQTSADALDDIVWNINTKNDSLQEIIPRMRRYAAEVLADKKVQFDVKVPEKIQHLKFSMEKRHDVYLMFSEVINNIYKHANATEVQIEIGTKDSAFYLHVQDNGRGFEKEKPTDRNGLQNLKMRTEKWKGSFVIHSEKQHGTEVIIKLPIKNSLK